MANISDCIDNAVAGGELKREKGEAAKAVLNDLIERYSAVMPDAQARALAQKDLGQATRRAARSRFHMVVNQLQTMRRLAAALQASDRPDLHLQSLVENVEGSGYKGESVVSLQRAYITSINAGIRDFLRATGQLPGGFQRNKALLNEVIRELHLEDTGNQIAKDMAEAIRRQQKRMLREFNARGGDIGELADFAVSHSHDAQAMRRAGFQVWRDQIFDRLDWSRITDRVTGRPFAARAGDPPGDRAAAEALLNDVFESVTSLGWNKRFPAMTRGGRALYNQRAEARILHFKSGSDWIAYNEAFGSGDPFTSAVGGLHGMARDVALMRVLGPNPNAGFEYAAQVASRRAQQMRAQGARVRDIAGIKREIEGITNRAITRTRAMLAHADGTANTPAQGFEGAAAFMGGVRSFVVSTKLGSALLSSVSDTVTMESAASAIGMGGGRILTRHVALMASGAERQVAADLGFVAETLASMGAGAARYLGETFSPEITHRMADFTMRVSGLNFWTDMGRTAFKMEFAAHMGRQAGRSWADMDAPLRGGLEARGITPADWDILRDPASMMTAPNGAKFISPDWWLEHQTRLPRDQAEGLAMRLLAAMEEQQEFAIPSVNLAGRVAFQGDARPGTPLGEAARSGVMFKSFAMSLMINQLRRFWAQPTPLARGVYAAKMMAGLTIMGALAVQLKELSKGRDPRPMDDRKFWAAAALQGGGVGIFGDFFAASTSRFGGGFGQTLAGPVIGLGEDILTPVASNIARAVQGEDTLLGRDIANLIRFNTPGASSIWFQRRAFDALVADQLQLFLDPEADALFARATRRAERDFGTPLWWERGAALPSRAPDPGNALGGLRQ